MLMSRWLLTRIFYSIYEVQGPAEKPDDF